MRVQYNVDVVLRSCNGSILVAGGERSDDYGKRLLRIVRAGQPDGAVQSVPHLYGVIHRVRTGGEQQALRLSLQRLKGVRIGLSCD